MYRVREKAEAYGLYRCTTCGVMIPVSAGEVLPTCPSRCPDAIWTFYTERSSEAPGEVREVVESFPGLDLSGDPKTIPAGARLSGVHLGPEPQHGPTPEPSLAAFHFDGRMYFSSAAEIKRKTRLIQS